MTWLGSFEVTRICDNLYRSGFSFKIEDRFYMFPIDLWNKSKSIWNKKFATDFFLFSKQEMNVVTTKLTKNCKDLLWLSENMDYCLT